MKVPVVVNNSTTNHLGWWWWGGGGGGAVSSTVTPPSSRESVQGIFPAPPFWHRASEKWNIPGLVHRNGQKRPAILLLIYGPVYSTFTFESCKNRAVSATNFAFCVYDIMQVKCVAQAYITSWANLFLVFIVIILSWPCVVDRTSGTSH